MDGNVLRGGLSENSAVDENIDIEVRNRSRIVGRIGDVDIRL